MEGGVCLCAHASITQRESCRLVHTFTQVARQRRTGVQIIPRPMNAQERTDPPPVCTYTPSIAWTGSPRESCQILSRSYTTDTRLHIPVEPRRPTQPPQVDNLKDKPKAA